MALSDLYDKQATLTTAQEDVEAQIRLFVRQLLAAHYTGRNDVITSDSDDNVAIVKAAAEAVALS